MDQRRILAALLIAGGIAGCSSLPGSAQLDAITAQTVKASFRDEGIAKVDRLVQDDSNRECSEAQAEGRAISAERAKAIEAANMKTVQWPSDGKYLGDWKAGEQIAQNGRGLTWTDDAKTPNGGNCYNCHQITKEEISFGTIGPSLYQYGKLRGVTNPAAPESRAIVEYTWGKIWNAKAYNACSNMPRAGYAHILDEAQVRHIVALLLDPQSPVNR
ncbi:sulfur oxidation c-type cytochrome SoxX [Caenimonas aquaedulcis]|uniref:sulfur oxidation c-type cytochrome SoxX n=1 Tax=Caenimonas aquaedulcis TaxID=2793270 RepID=UPI00338FCBD4